MSFGKRATSKATSAQSEPRETRAWSSDPADVQLDPPTSGILKRTVWLCLAAIVGAGYVAVTISAAPVNAKLNSNQYVVYLTQKVPQSSLLQTSTASAWKLGNCSLRNPFLLEEPSRASSSPNEEIFGKDQAAAQFEDRSNFLKCIAAEHSKPLCDPEIRSAFISDANLFFGDFSVLTSQMMAFAAAKDDGSQFANVMRELTNAHPELIDYTRSNRLKTIAAHERVSNAIQYASARGMITTSDVGFFSSSELKSLIASAPATQSMCE